MKKQVKTLLILAAALLGTAVNAQELFKGWIPTRADDRKAPNYLTRGKDSVTLRGTQKRNWFFFNPAATPVKAGDKVEVTFTVKGKGKILAGFFPYSSGWKSSGSAWKSYTLTPEAKAVKFTFTVSPNTTIARAAVGLTPGSEAVFSKFAIQKAK